MSAASFSPQASFQARQMAENVHTLQRASASRMGLQLSGGRLVAVQGATSIEAAQVVTGMVQEIASRVRLVEQEAVQPGVEQRDVKAIISRLSSNLEGIERSIDGLESSFPPEGDAVGFGREIRGWVREAKEQIDLLKGKVSPQVLQETIPDEVAVQRRLQRTQQARDIPSRGKTVVPYAPEAVVLAKAHCDDNCSLLRRLGLVWETRRDAKPPLYLTKDGSLRDAPTSVTGGWANLLGGGEVNCYDAYTISQAVYNSCLAEIAKLEQEVNSAEEPLERIAAIQESLRQIQLLKSTVSKLPQKFADQYGVKDADLGRMPADKKEDYGYQAIEDTVSKLNESTRKLEELMRGDLRAEIGIVERQVEQYARRIMELRETFQGHPPFPEATMAELHELFIEIAELKKEAIDLNDRCIAIRQDRVFGDFCGQAEGASEALQRVLGSLTRPESEVLELLKSADAEFLQGKRIREDTFLRAYAAVTAVDGAGIVSQLEAIEERKLAHLVEGAFAVFLELDQVMKDRTATPEKIEELQKGLHEASLQIKREYDEAQAALCIRLEEELATMTDAYNQLVHKREELLASGVSSQDFRILELCVAEAQMRQQIELLNTQFSCASLTTNSFTATKSYVMDYIAVVERRLSLSKQVMKCRPDERPGFEAMLATCPTCDTMLACAHDLGQDLALPKIQIVSGKEAKECHKKHPELAWGEPSLNHALCTPANWTALHSVCIKFSRASRMYVSVSKNEPLDIGVEGGVPAGLRGDPDFVGRPTNLMRTSAYIYLGHGEKVEEHVSYRGGQFPTVQAAKRALTHIIRDPSLQHGLYIHINALLTPTSLAVVDDKFLLQKHAENIAQALDELISEAEASGANAEEVARLRLLRKHLAISNIGVNEGAVGQTDYVGIYLGWHASIAEYCMPASEHLNEAVSQRVLQMHQCLSDDVLPTGAQAAQFAVLGAILQVGQELEAVYALNHFADANVGNNQFKMAALWKALDALIGSPCYTDCKSGKDRTGKIEGCAREYLDEIDMNIVDQRRELTGEFARLSEGLRGPQEEAWRRARDLLISGCLKKEELVECHKVLIQRGDAAFRAYVVQTFRDKIGVVFRGLGMVAGFDGFMGKPRFDITWTSMGTSGIPVTQPKMEVLGDLQREFPKLAVSSMYPYMNPKKGDAEYERYLEDRQREAVNRRLSQVLGSLAITQVNTGKPGFKVKGGKPLVRHSAGFDFEFVISKLGSADPKNPKMGELISLWTGLGELSPQEQQRYTGRIVAIAEENIPLEQKRAKWEAVLHEIAEEKASSLYPKAHVKT